MVSDYRSISEHLLRAQNVLFITGAGVSAESGLPTYRGIGGLYNQQDTEDNVPIEEALSGDRLLSDPALVWKHLNQIENACRKATHNTVHILIALFEKKINRVWVLTQNIDGFHHSAGSNNVIDIHGNIYDLVCMECSFTKKVNNYAEIDIPPICPNCKAHLRPKVVLFGEVLPLEKVVILKRELQQGFDVIFSIGTTSTFPYIANPIHQTYQKPGSTTIEINPQPTEVSHYCDYIIRENAGVALQNIMNDWDKLQKES